MKNKIDGILFILIGLIPSALWLMFSEASVVPVIMQWPTGEIVNIDEISQMTLQSLIEVNLGVGEVAQAIIALVSFLAFAVYGIITLKGQDQSSEPT